MIVRDWMTSRVHTVKPLDTVSHARELMERLRINQLPVVVDGKLVGIVTDRDLRDAFPSVLEVAVPGRRRRPRFTQPDEIRVESVMTSSVLGVAPDERLDHALRLMKTERIGALPVVDHGRLIGILTRSDVLAGCLDLLGAHAAAVVKGAPAGASDEIRRNW